MLLWEFHPLSIYESNATSHPSRFTASACAGSGLNGPEQSSTVSGLRTRKAANFECVGFLGWFGERRCNPYLLYGTNDGIYRPLKLIPPEPPIPRFYGVPGGRMLQYYIEGKPASPLY